MAAVVVATCAEYTIIGVLIHAQFLIPEIKKRTCYLLKYFRLPFIKHSDFDIMCFDSCFVLDTDLMSPPNGSLQFVLML